MRFTLLLPFPLLVVCLVSGGCSGTKKRASVDPYQGESGFCTQWAEAACSTSVVTACAAADPAACVDKQTSFCLGRLPPHYNSTNAKACIAAVKSAYSDAKLTKEEVEVVRNLAAPCDELNEGPAGDGESCATTEDCNTLLHLRCISKPGVGVGSCQVPVEVSAGFSCTQPNETCAIGFYCSVSATGANCNARLGAGALCTPDDLCLEDFECLGPSDPPTCVEKGNATDPCAGDTECKSGICAVNPASGGKCVDEVVLGPTDPICADLG